jgi:hypothetical protein
MFRRYETTNIYVPTIVSYDEGDSDVRSVAYQDALDKCSDSVQSSTLQIMRSGLDDGLSTV